MSRTPSATNANNSTRPTFALVLSRPSNRGRSDGTSTPSWRSFHSDSMCRPRVRRSSPADLPWGASRFIWSVVSRTSLIVLAVVAPAVPRWAASQFASAWKYLSAPIGFASRMCPERSNRLGSRHHPFCDRDALSANRETRDISAAVGSTCDQTLEWRRCAETHRSPRAASDLARRQAPRHSPIPTSSPCAQHGYGETLRVTRGRFVTCDCERHEYDRQSPRPRRPSRPPKQYSQATRVTCVGNRKLIHGCPVRTET